MKKYNNLFHAGYTMPWKYPKNWWHNITKPFRNFKYMIQRAKNGYSEWDLWGFDNFLVHILIDVLNELADTAHSFPEGKEFPTFEDWQNALRENAKLLEMSLDDDDNEILVNRYKDEYDKYYKEFHSMLGNNVDINEFFNSDIAKKYFEEEDAIWKLRMACGNKAFDWIAKHYRHLWD